MSNKVWRFAYDENSLKTILDSGELVFPAISPYSPGKHNTEDKVLADMGVGALVILANFKPHERIAVVRAAGKVTNIADGSVIVDWKKVVPSLSLHPHKIGAEQWEKENVFLINAPRVKQLKLDALKKKLFG